MVAAIGDVFGQFGEVSMLCCCVGDPELPHLPIPQTIPSAHPQTSDFAYALNS